MKLSLRKPAAAQSSPRRATKRPLRPGPEAIERRMMLAANFLQGVSFVDNNGNNAFDAGDAAKPGATIRLSDKATPNAQPRTAVTNAEGYYRFDNVAPGQYRLAELPPAGFVATGADLSAVFNSGTWDGTAIDVTMADPATATPVKVDRTPGIAGGYAGVGTAYTLFSGTPAFNNYTASPNATNAHQFQARLVAGDANTPVSPSFYTYCFDLYRLNPGMYGPFGVTPETVPANIPPAVTTNLGQIGWLCNHYGKNLASGSVDGAGLQLAFYELTYDATPGLTSGNFVVDSTVTDPAALASAQAYLDLARGRDERSIFLNATAAASDPNDYGTFGTQGLMTTESFNFANTPSASVGDFVWLDGDADGVQDPGEAGVNGVTVTLLNAAGVAVATQQTSGNGGYLFTGLVPGTYSVQFVAPGGYAITGKDKGGSDAADSNVDAATGKTAGFTLASGQADPTLDAGLTRVSGSIGGTKYKDLTGNGLSSDDKPLAGVKVYLDQNNNGKPDNGEASTTTGPNGTYSFAGLAPGKYTIREVVAPGWVRTGPTLSDNYVVTVTPGTVAGGNDFANAEIGCDCQISCVVYIINGCRQVSDLRGNVNPGDTVVARFAVRNASAGDPAVFSLASYTAPGGSFSASDASKQEVFDMATGTYTTNGTYALKVDVPDSYFQVDFVCGQVIDRFGPAGSNVFYSPQGRLIGADNDGRGLNDNALSEGDAGRADFWAGAGGQNLIRSLNGGSGSKALGHWLAGNFSNLYGGLAGKTNAEIAAIMKAVNCSSTYQLEADILATALSVYVTDADLAGMVANAYGFHVSFLGTAAKKVDVSSAGTYLGLSNNAKYSVWAILDAADARASNGFLGSSSYGRSRVNGLFASLNNAGSI